MSGRVRSKWWLSVGAPPRAASVPLVVLGLLAVLGWGCSGAPQVRHYRLAPEAAPSPGGAPEGLRLGVLPFRVDPPYDQDRIVYRVASEPQRVGFYSYHRWAAPLERMVPLAVAHLLEGRAGVALAEPADPERRYDALLGGRVLAVEEVDLADAEQGRAEVDLWLRDPDGGEIWRGRFEGSAEQDVETVGQVVALVERALADALGRGIEDALRHLPPPTADPVDSVDSAAPATDPSVDRRLDR